MESKRLTRPTVYPIDTRFFVVVFGEWGRMMVKAVVMYRGEVGDREASIEAVLTPRRLPRQRRHLLDGTMVMADMAGERRLVDFVSWWKGTWEEDHFALSMRSELDFVLEGIPRMQAAGINVEVDRHISERDIMSPHPVYLALDVVAVPGAFVATTRAVVGDEDASDLELDRALEKKRRWIKHNGKVAYLSQSTQLTKEVCEALGMKGVTWENKEVLVNMLRAVSDAKVVESERPVLRRLLTTEDERQVPKAINATLRPYQIDGMAWIRRALASGIGGILADAMGLGKSLQTIAAYMAMRERDPRYKALILAPKSLMGNWRKEFEKFTQGVTVLVWDGPNRKKYEHLLSSCDVVICAYETFKLDRGIISEHAFHLLVCDEAQKLKNPETASHQAVVHFPCGVQLALTGTPIENRLEDLHSLFAFASKGLLPPLKVFRETVVKPYKEGDPAAVEHLRQHVNPFILRRTKDEVLTDLPPKTIVDQLCPMTERQEQFYNDSLQEARFQRDQAAANGDKSALSALYLKIITRLRRIAVDPRLVEGGTGFTADDSGKLLTLRAIMDELDTDEDNKCLIFSQWTDCLSVVRDELVARGQPFSYLTGQTRDRDQQVQNFQEKAGIRYFLLGLKAGGVGLNITAANTVIMMDPWWNPASENQAYDRAHRIGQLRPVTVYRLIAEGTLEEKIASLKAIKQAIADGVIDEQAIPEFTVDIMSGLLG